MKFQLITLACCLSSLIVVEGSTEKKKKKKTSIPSTREQHTSILSSLFTTNRVVGGSDADQGDYPFMAGADGCGGSLVAPDVVLSAAHCRGVFETTVRIGSIFKDTGGQEVEIDKSQERVHPNYKKTALDNDVMLIKLTKEVAAKTVKINFDPLYPPEGASTPLKAIGFGHTKQDGELSDRLQEVKVGHIDHDDCNANYGDIRENTMLCAGLLIGGVGTCQGDSGGPIFDAKGVQVGVTSWGIGCARPNFPTVFARTSGFSSWLKENICEMATTKPDYCGTNKGTENVRIALTTDDYPRETSLSLTDSQGRVVLNQYKGGITKSGSTVNYEANVEPGAYKLVVSDSESDGLCCEYGVGKFEVFENGKRMISSDGKFTNVEVHQFTVGDAAGGANNARYYIDTSWTKPKRKI